MYKHLILLFFLHNGLYPDDTMDSFNKINLSVAIYKNYCYT